MGDKDRDPPTTPGRAFQPYQHLLPLVDIENVVLTKTSIFMTGFDTKYREQVYARINGIDTGCPCVAQLYHLRYGCSDADLKIKTITLDKEERRVYTGGSIRHFKEETHTHSTPYLESFLF
jgi:hypothetical protein